jgi:hypothetical protein
MNLGAAFHKGVEEEKEEEEEEEDSEGRQC